MAFRIRSFARGLACLCAFSLLLSIAGVARGEDLSFQAKFHTEDRNFVVIEDPLPHIKALLTSQLLHRAAARGPLAELLKDHGDGRDPVQLWNWISEHQRWIPRQIALGMSDGGIADLDHLVRAISLMELMQAAQKGDDGRNQRLIAELKMLRRAMLNEVRQLRLPRMRLYVRFRTADDAIALMDMLKQEIKEIDPKDLPEGLKLEPEDEAITVKFSLADQFDGDNAMGAFLKELNLQEADDPAFSREMIAAAQKIKLEASVRRSGDSLLLTLGPTDAGGSAGLPASFTLLPQDVGAVGADTLLWARWSTTRLKEAAQGWVALHEHWAGSNAFALLAHDEDGDETVLDAMRTAGMACLKLGDTGAARIWVDQPDAALRIAVREEHRPAAKELSHSALASWLPADVEAYSASMTENLGDYLSDVLSQVESRMSLRSLRGLLHPDDPNAAPAQHAEASYYTHFATLRELIHKSSHDRFEKGMLAVLGTHGHVQRLEASFILEGQATRMSLRNLPCPEIALIGKPKAPADAQTMKKYVEDVYSALSTGIHSAARGPQEAGKPLPAMHADAQLMDLGLGVPTWGFDAHSLLDATGEAKLNLAVEGDLQPHFFFVDGTLVFSTSQRLSKSLLDAHAGKSKRLLLPPDPAGGVIASGKSSGEAMARTMEHLSAWYNEYLNHLDRAGRAPADAADRREDGQKFFAVTAQVMRLVERIEWRTAQTADGQPAHIWRASINFDGQQK